MKDIVPLKIAFIYNPFSGSGNTEKDLNLFNKELNEEFMFKKIPTKKNEVIQQVKAICEEGYNRIIISGGDGTIMEAFNGIIQSGKNPIVAIIPRGTGNDLARSLGCYSKFCKNRSEYIKELIAGLKNPGNRYVNILSINNSIYFTNYLGIGCDAKISRNFNNNRTFPIPNKMLFFIFLIKDFFTGFSDNVEIEINSENDGKYIKTVNYYKNIIFLNNSSYAGGAIKTKPINPDLKKFKIILAKGLPEMFFLLFKGKIPDWLLEKIFKTGMVPVIETSDAKISFGKEKFIQIDGEDYTKEFSNEKVLIIKNQGKIRIFN